VIIAENGRLDVVVHNAGHMVFGPAEAFTLEQLAERYDVNVLSTQRVNRAALPQLRKHSSLMLLKSATISVARRSSLTSSSISVGRTDVCSSSTSFRYSFRNSGA
jgi:NADP-dependent 3-hydroxy acid dehydrogenase YdfG